MTPDLSIYSPLLGWGDFSDVYVEESESLTIRWENGRIESMATSSDSGAGLRIIKDSETRFGHANLTQPLSGSINPTDLKKFDPVQQQLIEKLSKKPLNPIKAPSWKSHIIQKDPTHFSLDDKVALLKRAFVATQTNERVRQVNINYGEKNKSIGYINSDGDSFLEKRTYLVFSITVTAEKDGERQNAYESMGGVLGFELFDGKQVEHLGSMVAERALAKLDSPQAPVGEMPVVIAASAGGTLIHEAVGHSLEADAVLEGTSPSFKGKIGKVIANPKLTVFDDPTVESKRGSFHFDDEGVPSEASKLIDQGVLKDYMFDRMSAKKAKRKSNGHGRRESFAHKPIPRMSNTLIAPGTDNPQQIVDSLKNGLLVTKMGGGQVNTVNGDFVFEVEEGFHIKDGQKQMVRGATLLGNGPEVLMTIDQVGSDHGWGIGTCGKEGQGVPVSDAIPTISIKKLVIGGQ